MTKEEYIKLINSIFESENMDYENIEETTPEEILFPETFQKNERKETLNASNLKREIIENKLLKCKQILVGNFTIMINNYDDNYDIRLWETKKITPTGQKCNMQYKVNLTKDSRFKSFQYKNLYNINKDILLDLIKHLQIIDKYPAFL